MVEIEILDPNLDKKPCPSAIQVESSQSIAATWQHIASSWDALDAREYWSCEFTELVVASSFSDPFKGLTWMLHHDKSFLSKLLVLACKICFPDNTWVQLFQNRGEAGQRAL